MSSLHERAGEVFLAALSRPAAERDAFLVEARMDRNFWVKLWMSPTGELLKMESGFGFSAVNREFFEGVASSEKAVERGDRSGRKGLSSPAQPLSRERGALRHANH